MKARDLFVFGLLACALAATATAASRTNRQRPNIVMIMSDDVGWGDLGCFGGGAMRGAPTPHLDQLARRGDALRQLLRTGKLHGGTRLVHYRTRAVPHRALAGPVAGRPGSPDAGDADGRRIHGGSRATPRSSSASGISATGSTRPTRLPMALTRCITCSPTTRGSTAIPTQVSTPDWPGTDNPEFMAEWNKFNLGGVGRKGRASGQRSRRAISPQAGSSHGRYRNGEKRYGRQVAAGSRQRQRTLLHVPEFHEGP